MLSVSSGFTIFISSSVGLFFLSYNCHTVLPCILSIWHIHLVFLHLFTIFISYHIYLVYVSSIFGIYCSICRSTVEYICSTSFVHFFQFCALLIPPFLLCLVRFSSELIVQGSVSCVPFFRVYWFPFSFLCHSVYSFCCNPWFPVSNCLCMTQCSCGCCKNCMLQNVPSCRNTWFMLCLWLMLCRYYTCSQLLLCSLLTFLYSSAVFLPPVLFQLWFFSYSYSFS